MTMRVATALYALCAPAVLAAQDAPPSDAIVVSAAITPLPAQRLPFTVATITPGDLAHSDSIAGAVSALAQVHVQMPGGRTGFASAFVRGADPNFTATLLDGVPLNSPTNSRGGASNLAEIPSLAVDRAELLIGPASMLHGSGPMAAAINLSLPPPSRNHRLRLSGALAGRGELTGAAVWQGPVAGPYGASASVVLDDSGQWIAGSSLRSRSIDLRIAPVDGSRGRLLFHYAQRDATAFPDSSGGPDLAIIRDLERRDSEEWIAALDQPVMLGRGLVLALSASWLDRRDRVVSPGVAPSAFSPSGVPAGEDDIRYRRAIGSGILSYSMQGWSISAGFQAQQESARTTGFMDFGIAIPTDFADDRTTLSLLTETAGTVGPFDVVGGLRVDDIDGIGTQLTGRVGARLPLGAGLAARASYGTGFKAPSFYALFNPFVGNRNLRPESGHGVELGLDWAPDGATSVALVAFRSCFTDLIDFVPADPPRLENRARVISRGAAIAVERRFDSVTLSGEIAHVRTVDADTGDALLNRPQWRVTTAARWQLNQRIELAANYALTSSQADFSMPVGPVRLAGYGRSSARISYRLRDEIRIAAELDNAFASGAYDAAGFPGRPRRVRITLSHGFQ